MRIKREFNQFTIKFVNVLVEMYFALFDEYIYESKFKYEYPNYSKRLEILGKLNLLKDVFKFCEVRLNYELKTVKKIPVFIKDKLECFREQFVEPSLNAMYLQPLAFSYNSGVVASWNVVK
jgi:hypothetical protein